MLLMPGQVEKLPNFFVGCLVENRVPEANAVEGLWRNHDNNFVGEFSQLFAG
jgi:hypothetical protein